MRQDADTWTQCSKPSSAQYELVHFRNEWKEKQLGKTLWMSVKGSCQGTKTQIYTSLPTPHHHHTHKHTYTHTYIYAQTHTSTKPHSQALVHRIKANNMHTHSHMHMNVHAYMHAHTCTCRLTHTCAHSYEQNR